MTSDGKNSVLAFIEYNVIKTLRQKRMGACGNAQAAYQTSFVIDDNNSQWLARLVQYNSLSHGRVQYNKHNWKWKGIKQGQQRNKLTQGERTINVKKVLNFNQG